MTTPFPPNSRYHGLPAVEVVTSSGRTVVCVARRWVPAPERFAEIDRHVVTETDRPDNLAARYLGDPEQFWRLCDANRALRPDELTRTPGRRLRITLPEGIPGAPDA